MKMLKSRIKLIYQYIYILIYRISFIQYIVLYIYRGIQSNDIFVSKPIRNKEFRR